MLEIRVRICSTRLPARDGISHTVAFVYGNCIYNDKNTIPGSINDGEKKKETSIAFNCVLLCQEGCYSVDCCRRVTLFFGKGNARYDVG